MVGMTHKTNAHTSEELKELQKYPLGLKKQLTASRIRELDMKYDFYVSFSGGKDSAVAVDFTAKILKSLGRKRMYVLNINTGLEYLSVQRFVKLFCEYVSKKYDIEIILETAYPEMSFVDVIKQYGYPIISKEVSQCIYEARKGINPDGTLNGKYSYRYEKLNGTKLDKNGQLSQYNCPQYKFLLDSPIPVSHICCMKVKKDPAYVYEKRTGQIPLIATTCEESRNRKTAWLENGCNAFNCERPKSAPFSFWTNQDMLHYIYEEKMPIAGAYGAIIPKSAMNGQLNMFAELQVMDSCELCTTGCPRTGCVYCLFGITQDPDRIMRLQEMEPKRADFVLRGGHFRESDGMWEPTKDGLGYWYVLDVLNENGIKVPYKNAELYRIAE